MKTFLILLLVTSSTFTSEAKGFAEGRRDQRQVLFGGTGLA